MVVLYSFTALPLFARVAKLFLAEVTQGKQVLFSIRDKHHFQIKKN
jgi:hypothetical protein